MRKILLAALLSVSAGAYAASTLTVSASAVKVSYLPASYGPVQVYLTGSTGSGCGGTLLPGLLTFTQGASSSGGSGTKTADDVTAFLAALSAAKAVSGATFTLTYVPGGTCEIDFWTRN